LSIIQIKRFSNNFYFSIEHHPGNKIVIDKQPGIQPM